MKVSMRRECSIMQEMLMASTSTKVEMQSRTHLERQLLWRRGDCWGSMLMPKDRIFNSTAGRRRNPAFAAYNNKAPGAKHRDGHRWDVTSARQTSRPHGPGLT